MIHTHPFLSDIYDSYTPLPVRHCICTAVCRYNLTGVSAAQLYCSSAQRTHRRLSATCVVYIWLVIAGLASGDNFPYHLDTRTPPCKFVLIIMSYNFLCVRGYKAIVVPHRSSHVTWYDGMMVYDVDGLP